MRCKRRQTLQKARSILLQSVAIILITISMGEIVLRVYNYYFPSFVFYTGSYDRFRGKPFANDYDFKLNSKGFKDREFSEKKENIYRILGIGDSFSFGVVPYKYNYLTLIESQLGKTEVEVLNMGIPAIGPKDYLSLLVNEGLALQPNMVLLSFFTGNDFDESKKRKFHEYSYVSSLLRYFIKLRPKYEGRTIHKQSQYCDNCPGFDHEQYLKIVYYRSSNYLVDNKSFFEKLENAQYYLKQIRNICEKQGIKLVVCIIPDELQINKNLQRDLKKAYYTNTDNLDFVLPNKVLSNELNNLNIDNIDLYEYFASSSHQLYRPRDSHWNIAGNQLAADIIKEYLGEHIL